MSSPSDPSPSPLAWVGPRAAFRLTAALAAVSLVSIAIGLLRIFAEIRIELMFFATIGALSMASHALRDPAHPFRRCLVAGAIAGAALGGFVLAMAVMLIALDPDNEMMGFAIVGGPLVAIAISAVLSTFGAILGFIGASILRHEGSESGDEADSILLAASAWLISTGGLAAILDVAPPGLAVLALGALVAAAVLRRQRTRAAWLRRVIAGAEPDWSLVEAGALGPLDELPRYVAIDRAACNAALVRRREPPATPFRESARLVPATRIDPGAHLALARIARGSRLALGLLLAAATLAAVPALRSSNAPPRPAPSHEHLGH